MARAVEDESLVEGPVDRPLGARAVVADDVVDEGVLEDAEVLEGIDEPTDVIAFDRSTLGSVIERLEAKALVARKPSREDKRVKLLYLTKAGETLLRDIVPAVDRAQARMLQPLKTSDRKTLLALLTRLVDLNNEASRVPLRAEDALEHFRKWG